MALLNLLDSDLSAWQQDLWTGVRWISTECGTVVDPFAFGKTDGVIHRVVNAEFEHRGSASCIYYTYQELI